MALIKLNDRAVKDATTFGSISSLGEMVFISKATASASASIEFSLGDYKEYQFYFVNCHPASDGAEFQFQASTDSGSNYNTTVTSTHFDAYHEENDQSPTLTYLTGFDQAQGTGFETIARDIGFDNDQSASGYLHIFNPSSTTFVKHFMSKFNFSGNNDFTGNSFHAGYFNTISALTNIKFQMSSGNIDAGEILLFGIN